MNRNIYTTICIFKKLHTETMFLSSNFITARPNPSGNGFCRPVTEITAWKVLIISHIIIKNVVWRLDIFYHFIIKSVGSKILY